MGLQLIMARVRNENNEWTHEADTYTNEIAGLVNKMLNLGKEIGLNNEDIFYLIVTEVHEQQLMNLIMLKDKRGCSSTGRAHDLHS